MVICYRILVKQMHSAGTRGARVQTNESITSLPRQGEVSEAEAIHTTAIALENGFELKASNISKG